MSRGRLSDCSGSTTGKMEVRVLTHSQAVSSACERRESIACARKGSLRLLLCPGVRARARGENARRLARASSSPRLPSRSEQKRFTGCVMTEECPCSPREATLGASPRRRTAAGRAYVSIIPRRFEKQTVAAPFEVHLHGGLRDPGEEHPLNVALSQNAPRLRVFYVRFCR
jgi:hypothetical protein